MVADLGLATEIVACPTCHATPMALALSSLQQPGRPAPAERARALTLSRAVREVESLVAGGERRGLELIEAARGVFADTRSAFGSEPEVRIDYIELVDRSTLEPVEIASPGTLFAVAAYVGTTRLIDNVVLG